MRKTRAQLGTTLLAVAALLLLVTLTSANGLGYTLHWWTVDGGGGTLSGNGYTLSGTAGQPDAAVWQGDGYILAGGFWGAAAADGHTVYLPVVIRNSP
jgi:hypothetical protein